MRKSIKILLTCLVSAGCLLCAIAFGSTWIPFGDIAAAIGSQLFGVPIAGGDAAVNAPIIIGLRLPRALLAFLVGAALSVSGTVMQSVLRNPLASSYTLGVSSGAAFGAALVLITGWTVPLLGGLTLPAAGLLFGVLTVVGAVSFSAKMDRGLNNNTIILVGMVLSLFINALISLLSALNRASMQSITLWQMGSFSMKGWQPVWILLPLVAVGVTVLTGFSRELDILSFGEEQAAAMGVPVRRSKWMLLIMCAVLTGCAISFAGIIGFIDLIAPHVVRRLFGSSHRVVLPMSAVIGGAFMTLADLAARTVISPSELPIGVVTALIGAPFFAWVYFRRRRSGC